MLKVLICSANYWPEITGVGKYSGEMAVWLAAHGCEVRVVAAPPYYPAWEVAAAYRGSPYRIEQVDGVRIWRTPLWVPRRAAGWTRVLHLLSFAAGSVPALLWWALRWRPDVCIAVAPFFTVAPVVLVASRLSGARSWLHVQDFEVDVAFRMGQLRGKLLQRMVGRLERFVFGTFDRVSSISQRMVERVAAKGVAGDRILCLRNWVDEQAIQPLVRPSRYRTQLGLADDALVVLWSGTMGDKQGLHLIPLVARRLAALPRWQFVVCGQGPQKAAVQAQAEGLPNIRFLSLQPTERLSELLGLADIHLLTQDPAAEDLVLPSKLSGMLASGRPVVATCAPGTELASVVKGCGRVVPPDDAAALADALESLAAAPDECRRLGQAARAYAEAHLSRDQVLTQWKSELERLVHSRVAGRAPE